MAPHRSSGALASHVLDTMHAILHAAEDGGVVDIHSRIERPATLSDAEAAALEQG
jgi:hypothetical protein